MLKLKLYNFYILNSITCTRTNTFRITVQVQIRMYSSLQRNKAVVVYTVQMYVQCAVLCE